MTQKKENVMRNVTINCKPTADKLSETFVVENVPADGQEAVDTWGTKVVTHCLFGTSWTVQMQAKYRALRKELTADKAATEMLSAQPSDGEKKRLTAGDKAIRTALSAGYEERVQGFMDGLGLDRKAAEKAADYVEGK
jgi:hypothetical protein